MSSADYGVIEAGDVSNWIDDNGAGFGIGRLPFIVAGATTFSEAGTVSGDNSPFCLTCHKAHGSSYKSSLLWDYRDGNEGDGCQQCHNK